jgi:hypothetical protein
MSGLKLRRHPAVLDPDGFQGKLSQSRRIMHSGFRENDDMVRYSEPRRRVITIRQSQFFQHAFVRIDKDSRI